MGVSDQRKETLKSYNKANKERILFQSAEFRDKLRLDMVEAYGGKCLHCGEADPIVLTLDHINDDPDPEYEWCGKSSRGGYNLYRRLRKEGWPKDRFQLLCFNCNMKKEHKRRRDGMVERMGPAPEIGPTISRTEARAKAKANSNNTSGFKGVLWDKQRNKWLARYRKDGKLYVIGRFRNIDDAARAYRKRIIEVFGPDAYVPTDEEIADLSKPTTQVIHASLEELEL